MGMEDIVYIINSQARNDNIAPKFAQLVIPINGSVQTDFLLNKKSRSLSTRYLI